MLNKLMFTAFAVLLMTIGGSSTSMAGPAFGGGCGGKGVCGDDLVPLSSEEAFAGALNHLRAYVKQIEIRGESYEPLYLTSNELSEIVDPPIARKCGSKQKR